MDKDSALQLLNKLLEIEEKNNIGNLTRKERMEFQSIIQDAFTEKEITYPEETTYRSIVYESKGLGPLPINQKIIVDIPQGKLVAEPSTDPNNPGIWIDLQPKDMDYSINMALIECTEKEKLRTLIWGDVYKEDYTNEISLENLDKLREDMETER